MKIVFFTEMGFGGKIPRDHNNMRTEFAWMCALDAEHYNIKHAMDAVSYIETPVFDLGIVIIPKKDPEFDIDKLRILCKKIAVMQEGPNWLWQDYTLEQQIWYFNTLVSADIIFTHNESDRKYYQGLTMHTDVRVMPSLMIEDAIGKLNNETRNGVIIGGNFVSWYSGFDSYMIAQELDDVVNAPSMGRRQPMEEHLIKHLPYMNWTQWIHALNKFKYGVHLMRTHAAGTFALNCSYLGIPCIGYRGLDTQEQLHPDLTVDLGDLESARKIAKKLRTDEEFYLYCSNITKQLYKEKYHENKFYTTFKKQFKVS
jgi:hypothetical protein